MKSTARSLPLLVASALVLSGASIITRHDRSDEAFLELGRTYSGALVHMNLEEPGAPPDGQGTLVAPRWVLTAAHVAAEVRAGHEVTIDGRRYPAAEFVLHPEWDGGARHDIALIRLRTPAEGVRPARLYRRADEFGRTVIVVGRGDLGTGRTGPAGNDGRVRGATNRVDGGDGPLIWWRFDAPQDSGVTHLEGISGPGDSGGPALIIDDGRIHVAGVSSAQSTRATQGREGVYGVTEYYVRVSAYAEWIIGVISGAGPGDESRHYTPIQAAASAPSANTAKSIRYRFARRRCSSPSSV